MAPSFIADLDLFAARLVLQSGVSRYAGVANLDIDPTWSAVTRPILESTLDESSHFVDGEPLRLAALLSKVKEALDLEDETPTGRRYYPYNALSQVELAAEGLVNGRERQVLSRFWEYGKRFADHVNWQLRKSRILLESDKSFVVLEDELWLRAARLVDGNPAAIGAYRELSDDLAARYVEFIRAAFADTSTADYVIIADESGFDGAAGSGQYQSTAGHTLRWQVGGEPIYIREMSPVGSLNLKSIAFMYLWCDDPQSVAEFLATHVADPAWVDPRSPEGAMVERGGFIADPVRSSVAW